MIMLEETETVWGIYGYIIFESFLLIKVTVEVKKHIKWKINKGLLHNTGNSAQYYGQT